MKKFRLVHGDDWQALYVDGIAVYQSHRLRAEDLILLLQEHSDLQKAIDFDFVDLDPVDDDIARDNGNFPAKASEFKMTKV